MKPAVNEITCRSVLTKSGIPGMKYCINPYVGCAHACRYCYATFMKRFTGHMEPWGSFVDVKVNAPEILQRQLRRAEKGTVMVSSVTDAYQPVEARYELTRKCLEILSFYNFPVSILTKSPLVLRDMDIISKFEDAEVGLTITTDDDRMRNIFEPYAPPVQARIDALKKLHQAGISTYVFIGPLLPMDTESLARKIGPYTDSVLIDSMNYVSKTAWLYKKHRLEKWLDRGFIDDIISRLRAGLLHKNISVIC
ncbi:MAG: radical SAM protein [Nitrospiraceae bacterium]|nr:MAG: radical SAM protein [Nitrospiraceae bacterium]